MLSDTEALLLHTKLMNDAGTFIERTSWESESIPTENHTRPVREPYALKQELNLVQIKRVV